MATKKVILKEIIDGAAGDSIYPQTSKDMVEGLEEALDAAGSVSTISVNGGAPLTPDGNKNIDITIPSTVTEATVSGWGFTKNTGTYSKPSEGIPSADFTSAVQTSLDKADSAIQSVTVGTTTTGAAGSSASVVNDGTDTEPVLSFTIPQGAQGIQGIQGPQGERGLPGESGVTGDVSGFTVIQTIDQSATYGATDIAGAASLKAINNELTGLKTEVNGTGMQINLVSYPNVMYTIDASGVWATTSNSNHSIFVPMQNGEYTLTASTSTPALYTVLTSNATPTAEATPAYATGYSNRIQISAGGTVTVQGTSGLYLWMRNDTSTSGAMAPTVMYSSGASRIDDIEERMDALEQDMLVETDIPISSIPSYSGIAIYATTNKWYKRSDLKYMLLSVSEGDVIRFKGNATNPTQYAFLHSNTVVDGSTPDYTPNTTLYTLGLGAEKEVVIPSGTAYLYFLQAFNSNRTPEYVKKDVAITESLSEVDSRLSGRIDDIDEAIDDFTTKTISISTTKNTLTNKFFDFVEGRKYNIKMTRVSGTGALPLTIQASSTSNSSHFNITTLADGESEKEIVWTANSYKYIGLWSSTGSASVSLEITWSIPEEIKEINNRLSECELVQKIKDSYFIDVEEDGLYFVDKYLHVGAKIDGNGFHAININEE